MKLDASKLRDWLDRVEDLTVLEDVDAQDDKAQLTNEIREAWLDALREEVAG